MVRLGGMSRMCACLVLSLGACASAPAVPPVSPAPERAAASPAHFASPYTYAWFIRAELLRDSGQLPLAIEAYRKALAGADEDAYLLARLASALSAHGDEAEAKATIEEALQVDPESEAAWLAAAELAERQNRFEAALAAYERAERAAPTSPRAPLALATLLRKHGAKERASAVLLRFAARTLPGTRAAYRAQLLSALASGSVARVREASLPYRAFVPPAAAELREAARFLLDHGEAAEALRVLSFVPESLDDAELRLRALFAAGSFGALETWLASCEPTTQEGRLLAARAYLLLGRPDEAERLVDAARALTPEAPSLQLLAAQIELLRGEYRVAAGDFARVPSGSAERAQARKGLAQAFAASGLPELGAELSSAQ